MTTDDLRALVTRWRLKASDLVIDSRQNLFSDQKVVDAKVYTLRVCADDLDRLIDGHIQPRP